MIIIRIDCQKTIDAKQQNIRQALLEKVGGSFPDAGPDRVYWAALCAALINCAPGEPLILSDTLLDFVTRTYGTLADGTA